MKKEISQEDLNEIRSRVNKLENELSKYKELLEAYENGDKNLQSVLNWLDETEELYRI